MDEEHPDQVGHTNAGLAPTTLRLRHNSLICSCRHIVSCRPTRPSSNMKAEEKDCIEGQISALARPAKRAGGTLHGRLSRESWEAKNNVQQTTHAAQNTQVSTWPMEETSAETQHHTQPDGKLDGQRSSGQPLALNHGDLVTFHNADQFRETCTLDIVPISPVRWE